MPFLVVHRGTGTIINAHECVLVVAESSDAFNAAVEDDDIDAILALAERTVKLTDLAIPTRTARRFNPLTDPPPGTMIAERTNE